MANRIYQKRVKVVKNIEVKKNYYKILLKSDIIVKKSLPGQFVHVRVSSVTEPLLRRPLSIHRVKGSNFEILYEIKGRGTKILSEKKHGEYLDIIGPLGNGFNTRYTIPACRQAWHDTRYTILVAGGIGVAPLFFLAQKLKTKPLVLIGANKRQKLVCVEDFRRLCCKVKIATDDGSMGFKGKVTELLTRILSTIDYRLSTIYACGPDAMLRELSKISIRNNMECQASLENFMGCGIGACLACVIKTKNGYKRVCKDGPVFDVSKIIW